MSDLPKSVGLLGAGNMSEAILRGLRHAGMQPDQLIASDPDVARREYITRELGVRTTTSNAEVVRASELVVLAVKPVHVEAATADLPISGGPLYVSIVAGCRIATLKHLLGAEVRIARAMPNTPALIGSGISALAHDSGLSAQDVERAEAVLCAIGRVVRVAEPLMDAVTGLSGSGPAYVYLFIEALTEAGMREGCSPEIARELAVETVIGAARLVRESGEHPAVLRERVASPGGTTVAGLAALEQAGLRAAIFSAVSAATARSRELGRDA
jgi:pyrroline-5-carboxylate reductase